MTSPPPIDPKLRQALRAWDVAPLAPDASERLIAGALAKSRPLPWHQYLVGEIERSLSEWSYALPYKAAAAAACLLIGIGLGASLEQPAINITGTALIMEGSGTQGLQAS